MTDRERYLLNRIVTLTIQHEQELMEARMEAEGFRNAFNEKSTEFEMYAREAINTRHELEAQLASAAEAGQAQAQTPPPSEEVAVLHAAPVVVDAEQNGSRPVGTDEPIVLIDEKGSAWPSPPPPVPPV